MKAGYVIALSTLSGAVIGAAAVQTLHAQSKPPVFLVGLQDTSNVEGFNKEYAPIARQSIRNHSGRPLAASVPIMIEGTAPAGRVAIIQWESVEQLKDWYNSPEYQKAREIGNKYAKFTLMAIEGIAQ